MDHPPLQANPNPIPPGEQRRGGISVRSITLAILKRPWIPVVFVLLISIPTSFVVLNSVRLFRSEAKVIVPVRETVYNISEMMGGGSTPAKPSHYYASILSSQTYVEAVTESMQSMGYAVTQGAVSNSVHFTSSTREPGLFIIYSLTPNRDLAQVLVEVAVEEFNRRITSLEQQDARSALDFINEQLTDLNDKTVEAEESLQRFLQENQFLLENPDLGVAQELTKLENELAEAETHLRLINLDIESIQGQIEALLSNSGGSQALSDRDQQLSSLRQEKRELEMAIAALSAQGEAADSGTADSLQARLRTVTADLLQTNSSSVGGQDDTQNVTLSSLRDLLEQLTVERKRARNRVQYFEARLETFRTAHPNISEDILTYTQLERQRDVLTQTLSILLEKKEETRIRMASQLGGMKVLDDATSATPLARNTLRKILLILIFSVVLGISVAVVYDIFRATIDAEPDIATNYRFPLLGVVPRFQQKDVKQTKREKRVAESAATPQANLISDFSSRSWFLEAMRSIRTSLMFHANEMNANCFAISSPMPSEGKTLTSANLAIMIQRGNKHTILIDCDLRKPKQHRQFGLPRKPGLSDYLLNDYVKWDDVVQKTHEPKLDFVAAGTSYHDPSELLASKEMRALVDRLRKEYDFVIIDTSPILPAVDSRIIGEYVDGLVLVARAEQTKARSFQSAVDLLENINIHIVGAILNHADRRYNNLYYYSYGRYHSYYQYYYRPYTYYGPYEESREQSEKEDQIAEDARIAQEEAAKGKNKDKA